MTKIFISIYCIIENITLYLRLMQLCTKRVQYLVYNILLIKHLNFRPVFEIAKSDS